MTIQLKSLDATTSNISEEAVAQLGASLRGCVARDGDAAYDEARTIWNAMVDRHPGLVIRALGASDVQQAVNFARNNGLVMSVRSGGHQIAGHAVAEGALMLDLSQMRSVRVDAGTKTAWIEPGATLGDIDKETAVYGLALPTGINSTTGIAGLALGGGFGWITRKCGMTIDSLVSADVVTADGKRRRASAKENSDLFWAIRGGGGNFGVVTAFEFTLHEVGPQVLSGLIVHPYAEAPKLLKEYRRIVAAAGDDLTVWTVLRKAPPLPFLPEQWHGKEVFVFAACYAGDIAEGERAMADLRAVGKPIADVIGPTPLRRLAGGFRSALDARGKELLEKPRLPGAVGRGDRDSVRRAEKQPRPGLRDLCCPGRRGDGTGARRCHGLSAARVTFHHEYPHPLERCRPGCRLQALGKGDVRQAGPLRHRQCLCELHAG